MIGTAGREVRSVGLAAVLPGFEVVNLALVGGVVTALPRAYRVDCSRHEPLLVVGHARGPVEVDRPLVGMDERDIAVVAQCPRDKLRSGDSSAIGDAPSGSPGCPDFAF